MENKMCIGACASSFKPIHGSKGYVNCKLCYGDDMEEIRLELKCPRRRRNKRKKVIVVRSCKCRQCKKTSIIPKNPVIPKVLDWNGDKGG